MVDGMAGNEWISAMCWLQTVPQCAASCKRHTGIGYFGTAARKLLRDERGDANEWLS